MSDAVKIKLLWRENVAEIEKSREITVENTLKIYRDAASGEIVFDVDGEDGEYSRVNVYEPRNISRAEVTANGYHAAILKSPVRGRDGERYGVIDGGSTWGTMLNGERLTPFGVYDTPESLESRELPTNLMRLPSGFFSVRAGDRISLGQGDMSYPVEIEVLGVLSLTDKGLELSDS